jgi:NADPH-dependent 2,4-dienoyl-CoA reductase/sulfur reductase-like enzyme/rhodanese-related sulfurtransferase/two-component sensor histidine kinase
MEKDDNKQVEMTRFASLVAHQLKSPVSAAGTLIKTLLSEYTGSLTPQQKDLLLRADKRLTEAVDTSKRMVSIVNPRSILDNDESFIDMSLQIRRCHARYEEEAAIKGITLDFDIKKEPIFIKANESAITEILNSLVSNALKYTPKSGKVSITLGLSRTEEKTLKLRISDSGIGIPEGNLTKIFKPFFRSATSQGSTLPGAGLGLAFVKTMVDTLGGEVIAGKSDMGGAEFILKLKLAKSSELDKANESKKRLRVVIIGGVAAGPKVASKVIRLAPETEVTIIEKDDVLSYSGCGLPYYVSGVVTKQSDLLSTAVKEVRDPVFFQNIKHVNVLNRTEAVYIDREHKRVKIKNLLKNYESWINYDKLVLATGAFATFPKIDGYNLKNIFTLDGVHGAEGIKAFLAGKKAKDVVIVGGGLIGLEMTEALVVKGCRVTIIEKEEHVFNILDKEISKLVQMHLEAHGVRVLTNTTITSFKAKQGSVAAALIENERIPADMIVLATGVSPAVGLAQDADLDIGETGAIKVNKRMETSDCDIFAAGDCAECYDVVSGLPYYVPLGSTANKEGRVVAINICGGNEIFLGINGTVACKVFDYFISKTGITENEARRRGFNVVCTLTAGPDREHFMPNVKTLMFKLVVDRQSRRILGAQAVGDSKGFNKIDIISACMMGRMTIDEVSNLDLCYAPAFSLAIDNVITAANVARNKIDGIFEGISSEQVHEKIKNKENIVLLDVRSHKEYEDFRIPGSLLIPLGVLRGRLFELPKNAEIITFCSISLRGYEAALILKSNGFENVKVMDGGILMWPYDIIEGL